MGEAEVEQDRWSEEVSKTLDVLEGPGDEPDHASTRDATVRVHSNEQVEEDVNVEDGDDEMEQTLPLRLKISSDRPSDNQQCAAVTESSGMGDSRYVGATGPMTNPMRGEEARRLLAAYSKEVHSLSAATFESLAGHLGHMKTHTDTTSTVLFPTKNSR